MPSSLSSNLAQTLSSPPGLGLGLGDVIARFVCAKKSYATRRVSKNTMGGLIIESTPCAGDLVLARVEELGQHRHIELESGRRAKLFPGDEIILAYGNRYAPDQYEALVPQSLDACHMVAAGGIASSAVCHHKNMGQPTRILPLGLIADREGKKLNLTHFTIETDSGLPRNKPFSIAVVGTSMNAGKTETASHLIRGLCNAGLRVGAAKVTGTGAGGDIWSMIDAGAHPVLDFTDAGLPSTYLATEAQIQYAMKTLFDHLCASNVQAIVFEVADGIFQKETADLLRSEAFREYADSVIFAASDSVGATAGVAWLRNHHLPVIAISGILSMSPLAMRETHEATSLPVLTPKTLGTAGIIEIVGMNSTPREQLIEARA